MPKVTVLMPVYNAEKYLSEAVDSILGQTFSDFEFLIIDDGSSDNSIDIIRSYNDARIRLVRNGQNLGISKTLNKGIELASAELIARMDADDISLPERLRKQFNFMTKNPQYALVSSNVKEISECGKTLTFYERDTKLFYFNLTFYCWIYHPSVMYRKEAVQDVGMYPDAFSEDFRLWSKLIRKYRIFNLQDILLKYRITSQSTSISVYADEYSESSMKQMIDNLKYYAGEDYALPVAWLEAYRNNFEYLRNPPKVDEMAACIRELDVIKNHVLSKENVNRDPRAIKLAAKLKKEHLLNSFLKKLPTVYTIKLLFKTRHFARLAKFIVYRLGKSMKSMFR